MSQDDKDGDSDYVPETPQNNTGKLITENTLSKKTPFKKAPSKKKPSKV